jgi:hypothetical protein
MGSPYGIATPLVNYLAGIPKRATDAMSGDSLRRTLADKLGIPLLSPDAVPDTSWHDQMIREAQKSFQGHPVIQPPVAPLAKQVKVK